jgi:hypothetical protein
MLYRLALHLLPAATVADLVAAGTVAEATAVVARTLAAPGMLLVVA